MSFFNGLLPYEIVLLVLGALFFLVLVLAFLILIVRGKPYGKLFPFFVVPVAMIGFPGIKVIEISEKMVKIDRGTQELAKNPTDNALRETLKQQVKDVTSRPMTDPAATVKVARAQVALGDNAAAEANVKKALAADPQSPAARQLQSRIELDRNLTALTTRVTSTPDDSSARARLAETVQEANRVDIASPVTLANLARAQALLGEEVKARENAAKVQKINPRLVPLALEPGVPPKPPEDGQETTHPLKQPEQVMRSDRIRRRLDRRP